MVTVALELEEMEGVFVNYILKEQLITQRNSIRTFPLMFSKGCYRSYALEYLQSYYSINADGKKLLVCFS